MNNQSRNAIPAALLGKLKTFMAAVDAVIATPAPVAAPARKPVVTDRQKSAIALTTAKPRVAAAPAAPAAEPAPAKPAKATDAELSPRRIAIIQDYLDDNFAFPEMNDPKFMYRVVSDEHAYQTARLVDLKERVRFEKGPKAAETFEELQRTSRLVADLFSVMKRVVRPAKVAS